MDMRTQLDKLTLTYFTTIHKLQGSEYPVAGTPLLMIHFVMLQSNLVYTGITMVDIPVWENVFLRKRQT